LSYARKEPRIARATVGPMTAIEQTHRGGGLDQPGLARHRDRANGERPELERGRRQIQCRVERLFPGDPLARVRAHAAHDGGECARCDRAGLVEF